MNGSAIDRIYIIAGIALLAAVFVVMLQSGRVKRRERSENFERAWDDLGQIMRERLLP